MQKPGEINKDTEIEISANFDKVTGKKFRYTGSILGIDASVYLDKLIPKVPGKITLVLDNEYKGK